MGETKKIELKKGEWKLSRISLNLKTFGEDQGTYEGLIEFENGDQESFKFRIRKDTAFRYITLISDDLIKGAENLSNELLKSLNEQGLINKTGT